jgi:hypothetical protein
MMDVMEPIASKLLDGTRNAGGKANLCPIMQKKDGKMGGLDRIKPTSELPDTPDSKDAIPYAKFQKSTQRLRRLFFRFPQVYSHRCEGPAGLYIPLRSTLVFLTV